MVEGGTWIAGLLTGVYRRREPLYAREGHFRLVAGDKCPDRSEYSLSDDG
jgi:hypothetical protein